MSTERAHHIASDDEVKQNILSPIIKATEAKA